MSDGPLGVQLLVVVILIFVNAFFAAAEIAVISLNAGKIRRQAEEGDKKAKRMLQMVEEPTGFLSTIQIGITLAGFLASAFAASSFAGKLVGWIVDDCGFTAISRGVLDTIAVIVITLILSYFTLVFGELVPKRMAMHNPDKIARFTCGVVYTVNRVFHPLVVLMSSSTNGILRLLHINPHEDEDNVSEEEIRLMVDIGEEKGAIEPEERELIENIFEFNNKNAEDVMIHRTDMVVVYADDSPEEIINTISESGLSRFPVCDEDIDDIIGILHTRKFLLNRESAEPKNLSELIDPAYFVPESVQTDTLLRDMQKKKMHMAIVVDEYGGTSGLVTMEDLLEEIVGNIYDEFDHQDNPQITRLEDNLWRVDGATDLEELYESLGLSFDENIHDEYDTLGGLIYSCLNEIPADGTMPQLTVDGLDISVELIRDRRVESALVSKHFDPPQAPEKKKDDNSSHKEEKDH